MPRKPRPLFQIRERDRGWQELLRQVQELKSSGAHVKVGVLDDGGRGSADHGGITTAELAAVHEFGTRDGRIPARSWVRSTFETNRSRYVQELGELLKQFLAGRMTIPRALEIMGARIAADIKKRVTTGPEVPPPNAPATLARKRGKTRRGSKGQVRTLIDTGRMVAAVTWQVVLSAAKR